MHLFKYLEFSFFLYFFLYGVHFLVATQLLLFLWQFKNSSFSQYPSTTSSEMLKIKPLKDVLQEFVNFTHNERTHCSNVYYTFEALQMLPASFLDCKEIKLYRSDISKFQKPSLWKQMFYFNINKDPITTNVSKN